ncbi:hypothetical protein [Nocardia pseudobrasiliensis]|uniref:4-oxalocrotonate tautomerase n=1 Tax=Nocardia pseudobrasiliensis TaxID=45979 RepID=A0A370IA19_9NOCA|nr:hypothetical protein [Nocardia pseudobrasiliensis]RDI67579.1 4-oxalocrotonate tautomerase [Nocardia pseudobrasiliensis]
MPHVEIAHFPAILSPEARARLEAAIVAVITTEFGVSTDAVSIGLVSVDPERWQERIYGPLITERPADNPLLRVPNY